MKKLLPCLVAAFLLSAIMPVRATLIVSGVINGVVTTTSDQMFFGTRVGMTVSGTFSYDYDLLSAPDSSGDRTVYLDSNALFRISSSAGEGGGFMGNGLLVQFMVDAAGLPYSVNGLGQPDISANSSYVGAIYGTGVYWGANVTYTITSFNPVPDTGATWLLLGLGLASVTVARRFLRRIQA